MTPEESINLLDNLIGMVEDNHDSDYDGALKVAINALEKQVPKQAIDRKPFAQIEIGRCPVCGGGVNSEDPYCYGCGQRILWEDE